MVARPSKPTRSGNAGEMSPDAAGRIDIKQYYSALLNSKNVEPVPQGGFRQMGGTWRKGTWRRPLSARTITSPSLSAGPHTGTQTVWTGTVAGTVAAVFVDGFDISAGTATFQVEAETAPGVWTLVGGPFAVGNNAVAESRMAAFAPGGQRSATGLRIRATFSESSTVAIVAVSAFFESGTPHRPRFTSIALDDGTAVVCFVTAGIGDFFTSAGFKGSVYLPTVTANMLPDLDFYAEGRTIGNFHGQLQTLRAFLVTQAQLQDWRRDNWPYNPAPDADLGGVYPKTDDKWEVIIRSPTAQYIYLSFTVNGETISAVPLTDNAGNPVQTGAPGEDWNYTAARIEDALEALPGLGVGVTVVYSNLVGVGAKLTVTFGGALSGQEYQLSVIITNTAEASALATHTQIGETDLEPLFSVSRGWPGAVAADLVQDRFGLARIPAVPGAIALSRVGEYFDFNEKGTTDESARLDKLRSQTTETVFHLVWSTYLLAFTSKGAYFAPNRTIERNTPLNFVKVSAVGAQPNAKPFMLEGEVHYVGINPEGIGGASNGGNQVMKAIYDDVATKYSAAPISLLASHLISGIVRSVSQAAQSDLDAERAWLMRADGRLVTGQFIGSQDITGFVEWIAAQLGQVREIGIDGNNRLWLPIERAGKYSIEMYDTSIFLQDAVTKTPNLAGVVSGLEDYEGDEVWAVADGYVVGPFTVAGAQIDLRDAYVSAVVGRWQAPYAEGMPEVYTTPNDDVIWRPGRIHTVHANVIETTSIAIGANGESPVDVPLLETTDPVDAPMPAKTKLLTVGGLLGSKVGTTVVFTQTRPGRFRVRDYSIGAKL